MQNTLSMTACAGSLLSRVKPKCRMALATHRLKLAEVNGEPPLVWCKLCGCFGQVMIRGLGRSCSGVAVKNSNGDTFLKRIEKGLHPIKE